MKTTNLTKKMTIAVACGMLVGLWLLSAPANAGDRHRDRGSATIHIQIPFRLGGSPNYDPYSYISSGFRIGYYPNHVWHRRYRPLVRRHNPVVRRDVYRDKYYRYDGTTHREKVVEDRHRSYYSPGRNQAITPPRTRVYREEGRNYTRTKERTTWIGADGRPHGTEIDRVTKVDPRGNTRTDEHVSLWNKNAGNNAPPADKESPLSGSKKLNKK